jgi:nitroimidazol reductase NimA-like FMN-containing flavoprotein (pyridoxamine 5'-phosphate oxidase superfamily)
MTTSLPLDHSGMGVLTRDECYDRLRGARVGRIAFVSQGDPVILPVNHAVDGESIVFRTGPGSKLLAGDSAVRVAFEVDGFDADRRSGWSVLVRGTASTVEDADEIQRLNRIGVWPWADLVERTHWIRIATYSVTGRQTVHPNR